MSSPCMGEIATTNLALFSPFLLHGCLVLIITSFIHRRVQVWEHRCKAFMMKVMTIGYLRNLVSPEQYALSSQAPPPFCYPASASGLSLHAL